MIRYARGLFQAFRAEARWKKLKGSAASEAKAVDSITPSPLAAIDINAVRESKRENIVGIIKTACDSVRV